MVTAGFDPYCCSWPVLLDGPLQILLLEADTARQQALQSLLQICYPAAQITGCATGTEALQAFESRCPDLVLLAARQPEMTVTEVIRCLRQIAPHVPIVLLADLPAETVPFLEEPKVDALVQPITPEQVYHSLQALNLLPPVPVHFDAAALLERLDGDRELAHSLLAQALLMLQSETLPASAQLDAESRQDLRQQAHRIKGMAANLSLLALQDYAQKLEQQTRLLELCPAAVVADTLDQSIRQLGAEMALLQKIPLWPGEDLPLQV